MKTKKPHGKVSRPIWEWLQNEYQRTSTPNILLNGTRELYEKTFNKKATDNNLQHCSAILITLEQSGWITRIKNNGIRGVILLKDKRGNMIPNLSTVVNGHQPELNMDMDRPVILSHFAEKPSTNSATGTRMKNALANAERFRAIFMEEREKNPDFKLINLVGLASIRFHERVESGAYRYIVGRNSNYSEGALIAFVHGMVGNDQSFIDLMPKIQKPKITAESHDNEKILSQIMEMVSKHAEGIASRASELDLSSLPTKEDIKSLKSSINELGIAQDKLVYAIWSGSSAPIKTSIDKWFPGLSTKMMREEVIPGVR